MSDHSGAPLVESKEALRLAPLLCLLGVVVLLSTVTLVIKYVFQHSSLEPTGLAWIRVTIGFIFLLAVTLVWDWRGLGSLAPQDFLKLAVVGFLGVFSYGIAARGLLYTSVTHYALIYSLLPSCTATLSALLGKDRMSLAKLFGIVISLMGCAIAVFYGSSDSAGSFGFGDALVLLFTAMMSAHIVFSSNVVKRYGVMVANTIMFGSSSLLLIGLAAVEFAEPAGGVVPAHIIVSVLYVGLATAAVFLLRYRALQSLTPAIVGTYHNLIPVCTILLAHLFLDEPLAGQTLIGGAAVVAGAELVRRANQPQQSSSWFANRLVWVSMPSQKSTN